MQFAFENRGGALLLVCHLQSGETVDTTIVEMFNNNRIAGFVPFEYDSYSNEIRYKISTTMTVGNILSGVMSRNIILGIVKGIITAYSEIEQYMIGGKNIVSGWDFIFSDISSGETELICLPLKLFQDAKGTLYDTLIDFMEKVQCDYREDLMYFETIRSYLADRHNFSATSLLNYIEEERRRATQLNTAYLVRVRTNERIKINKSVFVLGKDARVVDYAITDNPAVSRTHAQIINKGSDYYLIDTNSTNSSYINNIMCTSYFETKLDNGCTIRLGNEELVFCQ